jgi:hypothetical protein
MIKTSDIDKELLLYYINFLSKQIDCPEEFIDIVNKEFWNLI